VLSNTIGPSEAIESIVVCTLVTTATVLLLIVRQMTTIIAAAVDLQADIYTSLPPPPCTLCMHP
jgi:hypothetical protein